MRVLLRAYTQLNLGDDLFLHILSERYPEAEFVIGAETGNKYDRFLQKHANISGFGGHGFIYRVLRRLGCTPAMDKRLFRGIDAVMHIGGSIFMENEDDRFCENQLIAETEYCKKNGIPYHILSCNFGPYSTDGYKSRMHSCFERCTEICFRDSASYEQFSDIPSARYAADAAFSIDIERPHVRENVLGVSLISYKNRKCGDGYEQEYMSFLEELIRKQLDEGGEAELFCFCSAEGDEAAAQELAGRFDVDGRVRIVTYDGDVEGFISRFISCGRIVASRFHAVMLALIYHIPLIAHIYSEKTANVLRDASVLNKLEADKFKKYDLCGIYVDNTQKIWLNFDVLYKKFFTKNIDKT